MSTWTYRSSDGKAAQKIVPPLLESHDGRAPGADSEEKHEPVSDIDTVVVDSLKALDPEWPIREADIARRGRHGRKVPGADISRARSESPGSDRRRLVIRVATNKLLRPNQLVMGADDLTGCAGDDPDGNSTRNERIKNRIACQDQK